MNPVILIKRSQTLLALAISDWAVICSLTNGNHHLEEEEPADEPDVQYNAEVKDASPQPEPEVNFILLSLPF